MASFGNMEVNEVDDAEVPDEKQELFQRLARVAVKFFFQPKEQILVDFVIKEKCISLQRLEELFQNVKLVRMITTTLRNDRILTMRAKREVNSEGRRCKVIYYYIKYEQLVNVIRYKLEHIRTRLETLERELSTKNSFVCTACDKRWTDMESGELFNPKTLKFHCSICRRPVKEDTTGIPTDTRTLIAKFNEQIGPLYDIVEQVERVCKRT